ncbi:MAG: hypothetical protein Q7J30_01950 [Candidatus Azambacteria bacterium]|nr:hypothetical protein [Candidatus Azambacteria bacterium]
MKRYIFIIILLFAISYALYAEMAEVRLETGLPNIPEGPLPAGQELPAYINYLFIFGLGLITVLALGMMMYGGIQYILAAGNVAKVEDAKETITQALLGLGLLLVSYLLLRTINPDLVNLKNPDMTPTKFKGQPPPGVDVVVWLRENYLADEANKTQLQNLSKQPNGTKIATDLIRATKMGNGNLLICDATGNNCTWSEPIK